MKTLINAALLCVVFLLTTVTPTLADDPAKQAAPAAEAQAGAETLQSSANGGGCQAGGKCCGSAACAEAKKQQKDGLAATADCPCRRNKNKPHHNQ